MKRTIANLCVLALLAIAWVRTNERSAGAAQITEPAARGNGISGKARCDSAYCIRRISCRPRHRTF